MKKGLIISSIILLLLVVAYGLGIGFYAEKFQANTKIAGIDVSNLTFQEAEKKLETEILDQSFAIEENHKEIGQVKLKDLGAKLDTPKILKPVYYSQDPNRWLQAFFSNSEVKEDLSSHIKLDQVMVKQVVSDLGINNSERQAAKDAQITYSDGKGYEVKAEEAGTQIDTNLLADHMMDAVQQGDKAFDISQAYAQPVIKKDDEKITEKMQEIQKVLGTEITLNISGDKVKIPKDKIEEWLYFDGANQVTFDEEGVAEYIKTLNEKYASYDKTRKFNSTLSGEVTVQPGTLGWSINSESETEAIINDLKAGKDVTREPAFMGSGVGGDNDFGNTYIEIDLTYQKMFYYQEGVLQLETDIVSGMASATPPTPTVPGAYAIWNKEKDTKLEGINMQRGKEYVQPVDYWMPFDADGQGIHDANWQPYFGGDAYLYSGSQGCINTPPDVMATLFNMVEVGTPVIIF